MTSQPDTSHSALQDVAPPELIATIDGVVAGLVAGRRAKWWQQLQVKHLGSLAVPGE